MGEVIGVRRGRGGVVRPNGDLRASTQVNEVQFVMLQSRDVP